MGELNFLQKLIRRLQCKLFGHLFVSCEVYREEDCPDPEASFLGKYYCCRCCKEIEYYIFEEDCCEDCCTCKEE